MKFKYYFSKLIAKMQLPSIKDSKLERNTFVGRGSNLICVNLGKYSYVGNFCSMNNVTIGKFTSIASFVCIGGDAHPLDSFSTSLVFYKKHNVLKKYFGPTEGSNFVVNRQTIIGNDVWIGEKVFIKDGLNIGDGAVIGAHSVVTHDIPPYAIAVGAPAKIIKNRFSDSSIIRMQKIKWWDFDEEQLKSLCAESNQFFSFLENCEDENNSLG